MTRAGVVVAALVALAGTAAAEPDAKPKKDLERAAKSTQHGPPPAPGARPPALVNLYNTWTHEWLALAADEKPAKDLFERFLRDHYTNSPGPMVAELRDLLMSAAKHFKRDRVFVVSAFRHPKYNLLLRKKGHQVARDSHHTKGNAVDFHLPGVEVGKLHAWALEQKRGGVGLYRQSGFIHMDVGPVRSWEGE